MAVHDSVPEDSGRASMFYDPRIRGIFFQLLLIAFVIFLGYEIVSNTIANLERQNIASGFAFLDTTAGFGIIQSLIDYAEQSSYGRALIVGFLNTLLIAFIGIILATILGFIIGIARLSPNWVISRIAYVYIEIIRNIPLLLQIFFWYFAVLRAVPNPRDSVQIGESVFLNNRGIFAPRLLFESGSNIAVIAFLVALLGIFAVSHWARKRQEATGQQFPVFWASVGLIVGLPLVALLATGFPLGLDYPVLKGFNFQGGIKVTPEFMALLLALTIYTASFIAEIVRAGILAVSHGQTEAAHALGLRQGHTLRLVVVPQAMRVIIPPLTSQYLNLTKNSSLAVAIAYPDLVSVGGTILNQTGQAIEIIGIWMVVYLSLSLLTSAFMNWYNHRMALVER
ncbi:amino acid ABC transporter permease [Microbaculum marinum]|uniref:Amino acid ABC transporter permease n=1 Tax=Microbaculum marinum TaxID=1764581 RepID=A0AAW9S2C8_9HYPH